MRNYEMEEKEERKKEERRDRKQARILINSVKDYLKNSVTVGVQKELENGC